MMILLIIYQAPVFSFQKWPILKDEFGQMHSDCPGLVSIIIYKTQPVEVQSAYGANYSRFY